MPKLIVNPTSSSRKEIPLPRTLLSIGRDPSNDLVLPDAMVSRRHAVIEYRGNQFYLRDCNSSNGSVVNGDRVSERSLRDGDLLAIGTARLLFRDDLQIEDPGAKVVQHPSVPHLVCPSCQTAYRKGDLFCRECGVQLAQPSGPPKAVCASCGTAVPLPARFCNACGSALSTDGQRLDSTTGHQPVPEALRAEAAAGPEAPSGQPPTDPGSRVAPAKEPQGEASSEATREPAPAVPPAGQVAAGEPLPRVPRAESPRVSSLAPSPAASVVPLAAPARSFPPRPGPVGKPLRTAERRVGVAANKEAARFGPRLAAGLIDAILVTALQAIVVAPIAYYWWTRDITRTPADEPFLPILVSVSLILLSALLGLAYYMYFWGIKGATPGKEFLDLRVEGESGAFPIGLPRAALRVFGYLLSAAALGIGFLMIALQGHGLHDRIAGTRVVRRRREV
jgi:uncharacterized RDD family membrane protein YckC/predicted nucleic acid-binding Zn ribbon protein